MTAPASCPHRGDGLCWGCASTARAEQRRTRLLTDIAWHAKTGHCGGCGQPGDWCQCTPRAPCGCHDLHPMGSGIGRDPLDLFTDQPPAEQGTLL